MRNSTRRELAKARELLHFFLDGKTCFFCHELLNDTHNKVARGNSDGSPICRDITIHHKNGDHDDNHPSNHKLAHTGCHKSFHMRLLWKTKKLVAKQAKKK